MRLPEGISSLQQISSAQAALAAKLFLTEKSNTKRTRLQPSVHRRPFVRSFFMLVGLDWLYEAKEADVTGFVKKI
jgi:hypothetical protein